MNLNPACFLAQHGRFMVGIRPDPMPPCLGRLVRCHVIPRQLLKRHGFGHLIPDRRTWVLGCGGPTGAQGHHGAFDVTRSLWLPRAALPSATEQLAREIDQGWLWAFLEREYGEL